MELLGDPAGVAVRSRIARAAAPACDRDRAGGRIDRAIDE
jgi:hypothetical protein